MCVLVCVCGGGGGLNDMPGKEKIEWGGRGQADRQAVNLSDYRQRQRGGGGGGVDRQRDRQTVN